MCKEDCVQNSVNKNILYITILIFLTNCSLSNKEFAENNKSIDIFKKIDPIQRELNLDLKIKKFETFKSTPFLNNLTNSNGNINFETNFEKKRLTSFLKLKNLNQINQKYFLQITTILFFLMAKEQYLN